MCAVGSGEQQIPLCLDCYVMLSNALAVQAEIREHDLDRIEAEAAAIVGVPPLRVPRPPRNIIQTEHLNLTNVAVRDSTVGAINTGNLTMVNSAISVLHETGHEELSTALTDLTNAVLDGRETWVVDARKDGPRIVVQSEDRLLAFQELKRQTQEADSAMGLGKN